MKQQVDIGFLALCCLWLVAVAAYFAAAANKTLDPGALEFFKTTAEGLTFVVLALFRSNPPQIHYVTSADKPSTPTT